MDAKSLKTLQILEAIAGNRASSQRELSDHLRISLGLVNSCIKRLVKKGYCKVATIPKKRVKYALTPAGAMEKTRLTYAYLLSSYQYFKSAKKRLQTLFIQLHDQGVDRLLFFGTGEIAEIAHLSLSGTPLRLMDIIDPNREGETFENIVIKGIHRLKTKDYDMVLITTDDDQDQVCKLMLGAGVPSNKIRFF